MIGQFLHRYPLLGIHLQALLQDLDAGLTHCLLHHRIYLVTSTLDSLNNLVVIGPLKWQLSMQHAIQDDTSGPNIDPPIYLVILLVEEALRRHVCQTASIQILLLEEGDGSSNTEIYDLDLLLLGVNQQHIFQFKIPMDQIILVAVFHPFHDLPEKYLSSLLAQFSFLLHILQQLSALQKLHDDSHLHVLEREAVVHLYDVLMVQGLQDFCLDEDIVDVAD